jgi:hypothetical protein
MAIKEILEKEGKKETKKNTIRKHQKTSHLVIKYYIREENI